MSDDRSTEEPEQHGRRTPAEAWRRLTVSQRVIVVGALLLVVVLLVVNNNRQRAADAEERERRVDAMVTAMTPVTVVYEVEGSAENVSITIETPTGTSQQQDVTVPLTPDDGSGDAGLSAEFPSGHFVYISAQNEGEEGTVICRITVDGVVVSENTASGAYSIATCKGRA